MTAAIMPHATESDPDREAKRRAIAAARQSVMREGVIAHRDMAAWLDSMVTSEDLPPPDIKPWR